MKATSHRLHHPVVCLLVCLAFSGFALEAQTIHDGFATGTQPGQYAPGTDVTAASGTGTQWSTPSWKAVGPRKLIAVAEGLQYSDGTQELATTEGALSSPNTEGNAEIERDFAPYGPGYEVWFSLLMDRAPATHGYEDRFAFQLRSQTGGLKYSIRALDGSQQWHASYVPQGSNDEQLAPLPNTVYDDPVFVVGQIGSIGSKTARFRVWVNPKNLKDLGEPTWVSPEFQAQGVGRVALVADGGREGRFDEIRVGTSAAEVVPVKTPTP